MSANVRCVGHGRPLGLGFRAKAEGAPCGWKGERFPRMDMWLPKPDISGVWQTALNPAYVKAATAKKCPRCGGDVELIVPEDQGSGGMW